MRRIHWARVIAVALAVACAALARENAAQARRLAGLEHRHLIADYELSSSGGIVVELWCEEAGVTDPTAR